MSEAANAGSAGIARGVRARALRGIAWLAAGNAFAKAANFVRRAVLAHFLSPGDFGVIGVALLLLSWLEYFTETGIRSALVQRREEVDPYLSTAWAVQVVRGIALAAGVFLLAPHVAGFFDASESVLVLRCIAVVVLLRGLTNPALVRLKRSLDFKRQTLWNLSGAVAGVVVGITAALIRPDVWALVISVIAAEATRVVASYIVVPFRPSFGFDREKATALFGYGRWILLFNIVAFLSLNLDSIAVGRVIGVEALGYYQMGYQLAFVLLRNSATILSTVMFPALSRLDDPRERSKALFSVLTGIAPVAVLGAFLVGHVSEGLVLFLYGPQWGASASVIAILSWAAVFDTMSKLVYPFFNASGSPHFSAVTGAVKAVVLGSSVLPLVHWGGLRGAALSLALAEAVTLLVSLTLVSKLVDDARQRLLQPLKAGAAVALPWVVFLVLTPSARPAALLLAGVVGWSILVSARVGRRELRAGA